MQIHFPLRVSAFICVYLRLKKELMFRAFENDGIAVPSCDRCKTRKSIGDRVVVTAAAMAAHQLRSCNPRSDALSLNVVKAIAGLEKDFPEASREVTLRRFVVDPPDGMDVP